MSLEMIIKCYLSLRQSEENSVADITIQSFKNAKETERADSREYQYLGKEEIPKKERALSDVEGLIIFPNDLTLLLLPKA